MVAQMLAVPERPSLLASARVPDEKSDPVSFGPSFRAVSSSL
jgi:hypothetical protein